MPDNVVIPYTGVNTWFPVHLLGNDSLINCEDAVKYKRERALIKLMH